MEVTENSKDREVNHVDHCYSMISADLRSALSKMLCDFKSINDVYTGYLEGGIDQCNAFFTQIRVLGYPFVIRTSLQKDISDMPRLFFSFCKEYFSIQVCGAPFCVLTYLEMDCISGPTKKKPKSLNADETNTKTPAPKKQTRQWKKIGCPAKLNMRVIRFFPEYAVNADANYHIRKKKMTALKTDYRNPEKTIMYNDRVYLVMSNENKHSHSPYTPERIKRKKKPQSSSKSAKAERERIVKMLENIKSGQLKLKELSQSIADISHTVSDINVLNSANEELQKLLENLKNSNCNSENANTAAVELREQNVASTEDLEGTDLIQAALNRADLFPVERVLNQDESQPHELVYSQEPDGDSLITPVYRNYEKLPRNLSISKPSQDVNTELSVTYDVVSYLDLPINLKNVTKLIQEALNKPVIQDPVVIQHAIMDQAEVNKPEGAFVLKYYTDEEDKCENETALKQSLKRSLKSHSSGRGQKKQCQVEIGKPNIDSNNLQTESNEEFHQYSVVVEWSDTVD